MFLRMKKIMKATFFDVVIVLSGILTLSNFDFRRIPSLTISYFRRIPSLTISYFRRIPSLTISYFINQKFRKKFKFLNSNLFKDCVNLVPAED